MPRGWVLFGGADSQADEQDVQNGTEFEHDGASVDSVDESHRHPDSFEGI